MRRPAHPKVLEAIAAANRIDTAYDGDEWSQRLDGAFSDLFGTEVRAFWVTTGTAANCLALAALCPPYRSILCHQDAHIEVDEAGAPGFFTGGAKLTLLEGEGAKLDARTRSPPPATAFATTSTRSSPRCCRSPTRPNMASSTAPRRSLCSATWRSKRGLALHMDGARLANALATTGENIGDVTWRAGVDALSFGFVKNGGLNAECLIIFKPELADEIAVRRKRAGHLLSKGRYLAAQLLAMLEDDLWLENARAANAAARILAEAAPHRLVYPVEANELFVRATLEEAALLRDQGFDFYDWGPGEIRLVTSWDTDPEDVQRLGEAIAGL